MMLTERLREAGALLCIPVVDHIVIGKGCFVGMAERGSF
jgi:DNA repair protein RadC